MAHVRCDFHGDPTAYLDTDGRTVRPIPGREAEFDAEVWARSPGLRVELPGRKPSNA